MEKIAALGALGVCVGVLVLYLGFVYMTVPRTATAGIDWAHSRTSWIGVGVLVAAIIGAHLAIARQLWKGTQLHP